MQKLRQSYTVLLSIDAISKQVVTLTWVIGLLIVITFGHMKVTILLQSTNLSADPSGCYDTRSMVDVFGAKALKTMDDLQIGDLVFDGNRCSIFW